MSKIGRNAPCPCGSGRKYKHCCLGKATFAGSQPGNAGQERAPIEPASLAPPVSSPIMTPYTIVKLFESSDVFARMQRLEPEKAAQFWTTKKVAALATEDIVARLRKLGIDASREAYLALAKARASAWEVSNPWRDAIGTRLARHDDDFLGLAACELWKRYYPENPSIEMLDDKMQAGYRLSGKREGAKACDCWWEVWQIIAARLTPEMRTTRAAEVVFDGTQCLFNWIQDFAMELHNTALDERRYAPIGVQLCQAVLAHFPDEDTLFQTNFRAELGEFHFVAGDQAQGEAVLLALIRDYPDRAVGYVRLADKLGYGPTPDSGPIDQHRAQALLEQALARPVHDGADYDLERRLDDLREQMEKKGQCSKNPS